MRHITTIAVATGRAIARNVANEVRQQIVKDIETKADQWASENKLIHAGAARELADELKKKLKEQEKCQN